MTSIEEHNLQDRHDQQFEKIEGLLHRMMEKAPYDNLLGFFTCKSTMSDVSNRQTEPSVYMDDNTFSYTDGLPSRQKRFRSTDPGSGHLPDPQAKPEITAIQSHPGSLETAEAEVQIMAAYKIEKAPEYTGLNRRGPAGPRSGQDSHVSPVASGIRLPSLREVILVSGGAADTMSKLADNATFVRSRAFQPDNVSVAHETTQNTKLVRHHSKPAYAQTPSLQLNYVAHSCSRSGGTFNCLTENKGAPWYHNILPYLESTGKHGIAEMNSYSYHYSGPDLIPVKV